MRGGVTGVTPGVRMIRVSRGWQGSHLTTLPTREMVTPAGGITEVRVGGGGACSVGAETARVRQRCRGDDDESSRANVSIPVSRH